MPAMFSEADLDAFQRLRCAFDPHGLANPGKVMPTPRLCGEVPGPYREHPLERAGVADALLRGALSSCSTAERSRRPRRRWPRAAADGRSVRSAAARTKLAWGAPGAEPAVELRTARLDGSLEHNAGDLTAMLAGRRPARRRPGGVRRGRARCSRSTRRSARDGTPARRSAAWSLPATPARCATATARCATWSSGSRSRSATARSPGRAAR